MYTAGACLAFVSGLANRQHIAHIFAARHVIVRASRDRASRRCRCRRRRRVCRSAIIAVSAYHHHHLAQQFGGVLSVSPLCPVLPSASVSECVSCLVRRIERVCALIPRERPDDGHFELSTSLVAVAHWILTAAAAAEAATSVCLLCGCFATCVLGFV